LLSCSFTDHAIIDCIHEQNSLTAVTYVLRLFTEYVSVDHGRCVSYYRNFSRRAWSNEGASMRKVSMHYSAIQHFKEAPSCAPQCGKLTLYLPLPP
jgi:hypothetical protein